MPRGTRTKKLRAAELLDRAVRGPDMSLTFSRAGLSAEQKEILEAELVERYRIWSQSWLVPEMKVLVPELREAK